MKTVALLLLCTTASFYSYSQQITTTLPPVNKAELVKKYKHQRVISTLMLSGGAVMLLTGAIVVGENMDTELFDSWTTPQNSQSQERDNKTTLGTCLMIGGGAAMLLSIPVWKAANKNKKLAMQMGLTYNRLPSPQLPKSAAPQFLLTASF